MSMPKVTSLFKCLRIHSTPFVNIFDFSSQSGNDGHADRVARHFVQPTVGKSGRRRFLKLFIRKALQSPALLWRQPPHSSAVNDAVAILNGKSEHWLAGVFDAPPVLADAFLCGIHTEFLSKVAIFKWLLLIARQGVETRMRRFLCHSAQKDSIKSCLLFMES